MAGKNGAAFCVLLGNVRIYLERSYLNSVVVFVNCSILQSKVRFLCDLADHYVLGIFRGECS